MSHEVFALATIRPTAASNRPNSLSKFGLFDNLNKRLSDNISKPPLTLGSAPSSEKSAIPKRRIRIRLDLVEMQSSMAPEERV